MPYTKAIETLAYLKSMEPHGGATWEDGATFFGISRPGWVARYRALRRFLEAHPELKLAVPRPTEASGWRFRLTALMVTADGAGGVKPGQWDDNVQMLAMLHRMDVENDAAYELAVTDEKMGKRSKKAKGILARGGHIQAVIEMIESDQSKLATYI
jgi:hypothetical protein